MEHYQRILVAVDGSEEAELAFKKAINVTKRNNGTLFIAHVIDTRAFQTITSFDDEMASQAAEMAKQTLEEYAYYAHTQGVDNVEKIVEYGYPKNVIAKTLPDAHQIDLIMIGATGLNAVERFLIGSVSEHVIRHAHCDVLVVRTDLDNQPLPETPKK